MLNNLFRKYNQNKRGLWTIIIVIVFSYVIIQAVYGLLRNCLLYTSDAADE